MQARTIRHNAYKRIELAHVRFCVHTKAHSSLEILPKMTVSRKNVITDLSIAKPGFKKVSPQVYFKITGLACAE